MDLFVAIGNGALAGHLAEDHDVRHSVAAHTVAAVNAAGDLTRREQAGNGRIHRVHHCAGGG